MRNDDFPTKGDKLFISIDKEGNFLPRPFVYYAFLRDFID